MASNPKIDLLTISDKNGENTFTALINPDKFSIKYSTAEEKKVKKFITGLNFVRKTVTLTSKISFSLTIEGTGAIPLPKGTDKSKYVTDQVEKLKKIAVEYDKDDHALNTVKIEWGKTSFEGQAEGLDINYTLFNAEGAPLRAEVSCNFSAYQPWKDFYSELDQNSPDLTHVRTVKAGDTLPLLCHKVYKDASLYVQVARSNNLKSVMALQPGQRIYFPPLKNQ